MTSRFGPKFAPITLAGLLAKPTKALKWLIENLIPVGSLNVLSGDPGSFKTWIILHIVLCISRGEPLFGQFATQKGRVLLVDEENREDLLKERFTLLGAKPEDTAMISLMSNFKVDSPTDMQMLKEVVVREKINLVIFDSLVRMHTKEENDARQMASVFEPFKELMREDVAVLFTHHHRKQTMGMKYSVSQGLRGSSDILAAVDSHLGVEYDSSRKMLTLTQGKSRQAEAVQPFEVSIVKGQDSLSLQFEGDAEKSLMGKERAKEYIRSCLSLYPNGATRAELEDGTELGVGKNVFGEALKELVEEGVVEAKPGKHNKKVYSLKAPETPSEPDF